MSIASPYKGLNRSLAFLEGINPQYRVGGSSESHQHLWVCISIIIHGRSVAHLQRALLSEGWFATPLHSGA